MSVSQPVRSTTEPAERPRRRRLAALLGAVRLRVAKPYRQVNARQAQTLVDCGTLVLDVREPQEWQAGHVPGSRNIPLGEVSRRRGELPEMPVLVVDRSGPRSAMAATLLGQQGHEAFDLRGGLRAWDYSGRPLTAADGRAGSVV